MGDEAERYAEQDLLGNPVVDSDKNPIWMTRDKRVLFIREMGDEHLANTIRYLKCRGLHTPTEVKESTLAAAEFEMCGHRFWQKKYVQLLEEQARREKMPSAHSAQAAVR